MIARISWEKEDVLESSEGHVVIRLHSYSQFAQILWIAITKGSTLEDYKNAKKFKGKYIYAGQNGGISVGC